MGKPSTYNHLVIINYLIGSPSIWTGFFVWVGISIIFDPVRRFRVRTQFNTMKKTLFLILPLLLVQALKAQELPASSPSFTVKWTPTGLYLGSLSVQGEYNFGGPRSLTTKIGLPVAVRHAFTYDGNDVEFDMKATSVAAGYRMYLSQKHRRGLYLEPFVKYVHHQSEGLGTGTPEGKRAAMQFTNQYKALGAGAQLGAQFLLSKRVVMDLFFLGPEINAATNTLRAQEVTHTIAWNEVEARDAEDVLRAFVNQFPFVRNRTTITVDQNNRTVTGAFKGALPGYRAGISVGITL